MVEQVDELFEKSKEEGLQILSKMMEAEKIIYSSDKTFMDCLKKIPDSEQVR